MAFEADGSAFPVMERYKRCRMAFLASSSAFPVMGERGWHCAAPLANGSTFSIWGSVHNAAWPLWPTTAAFLEKRRLRVAFLTSRKPLPCDRGESVLCRVASLASSSTFPKEGEHALRHVA